MAGLGVVGRGTARCGGAGRGTAGLGWAWHVAGRGSAWRGSRRGSARLGAVGQGLARPGVVRLGEVRFEVGCGWARRGVARPGSAGLGWARFRAGHGGVRQGEAWSGLARYGEVRGRAWPGRARRGEARRGRAWLGEVRGAVFTQPGQARTPDPSHTSVQRSREREMQIQLIAVGKGSLLMHSQRGLNRRDSLARDLGLLTSKRGKTDEDRDQISDMEFQLGLYWNEKLGVVLPAFNVLRSIQDGAKIAKLGKHVEKALHYTEKDFSVIYDGPQDIDGLLQDHSFRDVRMVGVMGKMVERTRPIFRDWGLKATFEVDDEVLDFNQITLACENAGNYAGLGDFRPHFGRFTAEVTRIG